MAECKLREAIEEEIRVREARVSGGETRRNDWTMISVLRQVLAAGDGDPAPLRDRGEGR